VRQFRTSPGPTDVPYFHVVFTLPAVAKPARRHLQPACPLSLDERGVTFHTWQPAWCALASASADAALWAWLSRK